MRTVHLAGWQKIAWALDEDLRWARTALEGVVCFTGLARAEMVLAAWWPALQALGPGVLRGKQVVCFADNPPAFYLTRPGFAAVASRVDLWIARSAEAMHQFEALGLPVARAPYCVDPGIFRPLQEAARVRSELGIPDGAFVVGNFHRDSEGADLGRPKAQKGADVFLDIVRALHRRRPETFVLLAGPRRHWLLRRLEEAGIPHVFAGEKPGIEDDYARNILDRSALNRLYQALDVCVVSSRWEGGPYSVLEALLAGRPVVSTPVGIARDLLDGAAQFRTVEEGVSVLADHAATGVLEEPTARAAARARERNTATVLRDALQAIVEGQPPGSGRRIGPLRCGWEMLRARVGGAAWPDPDPGLAAWVGRVSAAPAGSCFYEAESSDPSALAASAAGIRVALAA